MAVNFAEMPINYGLKYAFDCNTYSNGNVWENYTGDANAIVQNAYKANDGSVFFPAGNGFAYWNNNDTTYTDSTKYIICKALDTPSKSSYYWIFTERAGSSSYTTDIDIYGSGSVFALYSNGGGNTSSVLSTDYHIIATVKSGTTATLYIDGKQIAQATEKKTFNPTNYGINTASTTGKIPTESDQNTYVRCAIVCNNAHSAFEVKQNSDWLLIQYGLASEPLESKMSGADAAAIAWCIARNLEQTNSLIMQKKMFKEGLKKGIEGGADITEEFEQDTPNLNISTDGDGGISEPFIGQFTDSIYYTDPTGAYVKMWLDLSWQEITEDDGRTTTRIGRMIYEAYDADGTLLDRSITQSLSGYGWVNIYDGGFYTETKVVSLRINGNYVVGVHKRVYGDGKVEWIEADWSPIGEAFSIMDNAVRVSNIPPEIIS